MRATGSLASIELEWSNSIDMIGILQVDPWCYLTRKKCRQMILTLADDYGDRKQDREFPNLRCSSWKYGAERYLRHSTAGVLIWAPFQVPGGATKYLHRQ